jgi:ferredoxin--NADP+ reductase
MVFLIDMIERLPTPWGLVRSGVSPDHLKTKTVAKVFEKIAKESGFRLFANVEIGKDVSLKDLREAYDVVVLAIGASRGRRLGIKGEELPNYFSSAQFVPWYNGHPDFSELVVNLNTETAIVIGAGNVAMDIARILAREPSELRSTDVAEHALEVFESSSVRKVVICGRRGPEHAAFTAPEIRDLAKLENIDVKFDAEQINSAITRAEMLATAEKDLHSNLEAMRLLSLRNKKKCNRSLEIRFLSSPLEFKGNGKLEEVIFAVNEVSKGRVVNSDKTFSIEAGLVISAIGYETQNIPGIKYEQGKITNIAGHVEHNVYVTGWAKRGPVGLIGTNKSDASDVVQLIISNLKKPKNSAAIEALLKSDHQTIDQSGWEKINASELISGELVGKPRKKIVNWKRLLEVGFPGR